MFMGCIFPVFLILALIFGVATVTEVAAMAAFYSFMVGFFIYKSLDFNGIKKDFYCLL